MHKNSQDNQLTHIDVAEDTFEEKMRLNSIANSDRYKEYDFSRHAKLAKQVEAYAKLNGIEDTSKLLNVFIPGTFKAS